jgi:hypothetical protein
LLNEVIIQQAVFELVNGSDYQAFLQSIKARVQQAQLRAVVAVNKELILLYWQIGKEILQRQQREGWGAKVIDRLSADLHSAFPQRGIGFATPEPDYTQLIYPEGLDYFPPVLM